MSEKKDKKIAQEFLSSWVISFSLLMAYHISPRLYPALYKLLQYTIPVYLFSSSESSPSLWLSTISPTTSKSSS